VNDLSFNDWASDSFKISESFVYGEINHHEKEALPADYVAHGRTLIEKQLVTAGYRLKNLVVAMFGKSENFLQ
jgi:hypothetical protein